MVANNLYAPGWVFKVNNEFMGRGHAYIFMDQMKNLVKLRQAKLTISDAIINKIRFVIEAQLHKKATLVMDQIYEDWDDFLKRFCKVGGVIEAMPNTPPHHINKPSVSIFIEPSGEIHVTGALDKIEAGRYINCGFFFPQTSVSGPTINKLGLDMGKVLHQKGMIGFFDIDFISY